MTPDPGSLALPRHEVGPEDYDAQGRFLYPCDVEDAMPEGNLAWWLGVYLVQAISRLVADPARDSVHANMPIYYRKGEPKRHVSPDAFYLPGVPMDQRRRSYCLWKTGVPPRVTFEILSRHHEYKDEVVNRALYEQLGVTEYYWFDPERTLLTALRLDRKSGRYRPEQPNAAGRYPSPALGLEVGVEGDLLALFKDDRYVEPSEALVTDLHSLLAEKDSRLAEKDSRLAEKDGLLAEKDSRLAEKDSRLAEKDGLLAEKDSRLAEKDRLLTEKETELEVLRRRLAELEGDSPRA